MKKLLCVLLTLAMLFSLVPAGFAEDIEIVDEPEEIGEIDVVEPAAETEQPAAEADEEPGGIIASGECGENLTWTLDENGLMTISGTGDMYDAMGTDPSSSWQGHAADILTLVIEEGATSVGVEMFLGCSNLKNAVIPGSVSFISFNSFHDCTSLENLSLGEGLQSISFEAFAGCTALRSLTLPDSLTDLGVGTFNGCSGLTEVRFGSGLTTIGNGVFFNCVALEEITIPEGVAEIRGSAFAGCTGLRSVVIPASVVSIGMLAFRDCTSLTSVCLEGSVISMGESVFQGCTALETAGPLGGDYNIQFSWTEQIPDYAFSNCGGLKEATLPETLTRIGASAFANCALESVTIPDSVSFLGESSFSGCASLAVVHLPEQLAELRYNAFLDCTALTEVYYKGYEEAVEFYRNGHGWDGEGNAPLFDATWYYTKTLEEGWHLCGNDLLYQYDDAASRLSIKGSGPMWDFWRFGSEIMTPWAEVQSEIADVRFEPGVTYIGSNALYDCDSLLTISLPESLTHIGSNALCNCDSLKTVSLPESLTSIGDYAFAYCSELTGVTAPDTLLEIGEGAFNQCEKLTDFAIPGSVTSIGESAFFECRSLKQADIPEGLTLIAKLAFGRCESLAELRIPDSVTVIGDGAFESCSSLTCITIPDSVLTVDRNAFLQCSALETLTIGDHVEEIGKNAFSNCAALKEVTIPDSVKELGERAFFNSGLETATLGNGITTIEYGLFEQCENLKSVSIQESVTCIFTCAFQNCSSLESIVIPDSVETIYAWAFHSCTKLAEIRFGSGLQYINKSAFDGCRSLKEIVLPEGLQYIGEYAFSTCDELTDVKLPDSLKRIAAHAFSGCKKLRIMQMPKSLEYLGYLAIDSHVKEIFFTGSAPQIEEDAFLAMYATAFYPADDASWTEDVMQQYGANQLTWVPLGSAIHLDRSSITLPVKENTVLNVLTDNGTRVHGIWASSDENVATVTENGRVVARKYGTCTVTVYAVDQSFSCEVQTLFWDVADPSKYYFKHVYWAAEKGITKGYDLEYFAPQEECTREQMMTFLWRLADQPEPETTSSPFPDVKSGAYYYKAVLWGVEKGITNGYSSGPNAGKFGVGLPCTREQAMTFLWRFAGRPEPTTTKNPFKDMKKSDYFYKAVLWASENKIANGYTSGEYAGKYGVGLACLREHMVTFLSKYASKFM